MDFAKKVIDEEEYFTNILQLFIPLSHLHLHFPLL